MDRKRYADYDNQFRGSTTWEDRTIALYGMIEAIAKPNDQPEPAPNVSLEASVTALKELIARTAMDPAIHELTMMMLVDQIRDAAQTPQGEVILTHEGFVCASQEDVIDCIDKVVGTRHGKLVFIPDQEQQPEDTLRLESPARMFYRHDRSRPQTVRGGGE